MNRTRQGRFFGTQEALEQDAKEYRLAHLCEQEVDGERGYNSITRVYHHKDAENDHKVYWRLLTPDFNRRNEIAGMEFSHITFHHSVQAPAEILWTLTRLRFPQTLVDGEE